MSEPIVQPGVAEPAKTVIHLSLFGLLAVVTAYNAVAGAERKDRRLLANAVLYGAMTLFEARQVLRHLE